MFLVESDHLATLGLHHTPYFCFPKVPTFNGLIVPTQKQKIEKNIQTLRAGNVTLFANVKESKKPLKRLTLMNKSHCFRRQHSTINVHNKDNYYYTKILPELHGVSVGTQIILYLTQAHHSYIYICCTNQQVTSVH